jgi:hypothetical protein
MQGISGLAANRLASQEGLCSMQYVFISVRDQVNPKATQRPEEVNEKSQ